MGTMIGNKVWWSNIPSELTDGGQFLRYWIRKMSVRGVWGSGVTYGFVQGAGVTSFIPLAALGTQAGMGCTCLPTDN